MSEPTAANRGRMSRNKGKRAEREIVNLLQPIVDSTFKDYGIVPPVLQRNTLQSDRGGYDITGIDWFAPEVKHCETLAPDQWWKQCCEQAKSSQVPVLFYRSNHKPWRVRCMVCAQVAQGVHTLMRVDIDVDTFLPYFAQLLRWGLGVLS